MPFKDAAQYLTLQHFLKNCFVTELLKMRSHKTTLSCYDLHFPHETYPVWDVVDVTAAPARPWNTPL